MHPDIAPPFGKRSAFQSLQLAPLQPDRAGLGDGNAAAVGGMRAALYLAPRRNQKGVGVFLPLEGLQVALSGLVGIVGDPSCLNLVAGLPGALADRGHDTLSPCPDFRRESPAVASGKRRQKGLRCVLHR